MKKKTNDVWVPWFLGNALVLLLLCVAVACQLNKLANAPWPAESCQRDLVEQSVMCVDAHGDFSKYYISRPAR